MDPKAALDRLQDISSQVRAAVIFERGGKVIGSTLADEERSRRVAHEATELLRDAENRRGDRGARVDQAGATGDFAQLEVALRAGSVFVVRDEERLIAATTPPDPTVGLVFYDLKSCLRDLAAPEPARQPAAGRKTATSKKEAGEKS
jgi:predicted regulator of Ras-like GTPase activity (Roadblock/LC7/MglB family)